MFINIFSNGKLLFCLVDFGLACCSGFAHDTLCHAHCPYNQNVNQPQLWGLALGNQLSGLDVEVAC